MLSKLQKASDKVGLFLQNKPFSTAWLQFQFQRHFHMERKNSSKVQGLYDFCKKTFTPSGTPPPSSQAVRDLCSLLDTVGPADVGLEEQSSDDDRGLGFSGLYGLNRMCIFCFPTSAVIPLHDHPGMTVLSKVLYGSMHVKAYDWVEPARFQETKGPGYRPDFVISVRNLNSKCLLSIVVRNGKIRVRVRVCPFWFRTRMTICHPGSGNKPRFLNCGCGPGSTRKNLGFWNPVRLAKLATDKVLTPQYGTSVLYPKSGGNLHCFTAVTPCAVLDILTPPYNEDAGRKCTYYVDYPFPTFSAVNGAEVSNEKEEYAWLSEIDTPDDLYMRPGVYAGPAILV
ncbi:Plant cysteine oxidase 3 [Citrus sinensis]|uniref:Plant cysteine oxidase 3 n=1 Tax=Citrus sinensis TaxID=2711 RepID=A0ACB8LYT1_CITSI|nr:Plant cysteine oxidase 3 [Citrus sinensis]